MAHGYVIAQTEVKDPEACGEHAAAAAPILAKFGGACLIRGGKPETAEADAPASARARTLADEVRPGETRLGMQTTGYLERGGEP
jgi:hypothetical protein